MNKKILISTLALTVAAFLIGWQYNAQGWSGCMKEKLQEFKQEFQRKQAQGYDVSEAERLIRETRGAIQSKSWQKAWQLLRQAFIALQNAKRAVHVCGDGICEKSETVENCPEDCITFPTNSPVKSIELFIAKGGRVDWYKGSAHELIAYDAISNDILKNSEVYIIKPDGSGKKCVTCDSAIPKGFVGQPAWHPDGEHIIIQVENSNSKHRSMEHVSFGLNNDLWIIKKDGTGAKRIWTTGLNHAALHPHFSHDGAKLIFAERIPTGVKIPGIGGLTPGGENHWDGWQIRIADFDPENMEITKSTIIKPNGRGFYETNDFYNDKEFTYSFTSNGQPYVDDIYSIKIDGTNVVHIINSPTTWEEHGTFSPAGTGDFVFLSSRFDSTWKAPASKAATLALELFLKKTNGDIIQLTEMNKNTGLNTRYRYLVSDYDWDKDGERIVIQIAPINKRTGRIDSPQIWMIKFKK